MLKQIYVRAQADHVESLYKGSPASAVEELIWNALDADAKEVKVDLILNELGSVVAVRVTDDGSGIDIARVESTFGALGGSWKRGESVTPLSHRRLHGRHGCGRFRAFALGGHAQWRTAVREGDGVAAYRIVGDADRPGVFDVDTCADGPTVGTEVLIENVRVAADSLLNADETVRTLAAKFALYLKNYPDVRIYFNGLPVTPVIVEKSTTDYRITLEGGAEAKLEVIEWKRKFVGAGRLVFAGTDGFQLHEQPAGVRSGLDIPFTAYLISPRLAALHAENALVMGDLHPEVRQYVAEAQKILKAHFAAFGDVKTPFETEWAERIGAMSIEDRQRLLKLLKKSLKAK